ncbi:MULTISPECIES: MFS transporter [Desulfosporosinus]|uniref:Inner membrane metabolite transport protein YgcS n=1 Tax=Desulfosporosinus acididurans TaxID=476652 RepID=A0A0J1FU71_9FIRM|nr:MULTISPECIES: MFS transporter [Desulfosporosinus]KLU66995.1 inner membrane metabolite transport protein YgcS [Desulfosporosinus acididurans]
MKNGEFVVKTKDDIIRFIDQNPTQKRAFMLVLIALGGIFLEAYDLTILGTATDQLIKQFHLTAAGLSVIMTIMPFGGMIGALVGGLYTDRFGRKLMFLIDLILLVISSFGAALSPSPQILGFFRFFLGIGIGIDVPIAFSFITELSNFKSRGKYTNYWQVFWYLATTSSALVVIGLYSLGTGNTLWRWSVAGGGLIALAVLILRLMFLKESPMWAAKNLPLKEATEILEKTYKIKVKLEQPDVSEDKHLKKVPLKILFNKRYRPRTILATAIKTTQSLQYYAVGLYIPLIAVFVMGEGKLQSLGGTALINLAGILGGFIGAQLTFKLGSRKLSIFGYVIVIIAMLSIGFSYGGVPMWVIALLVALFLFGHSAGPGSNGMTMGALSFPTSLRGLGSGFVEGSSRLGSMIGTFAFPIILTNFGLSKTMLILSLAPLIGLISALIIKWEPVGKDIEREDEEVREEIRLQTTAR